MAALQDNIAKYESVHGHIKEVKGSGPVMPLILEGRQLRPDYASNWILSRLTFCLAAYVFDIRQIKSYFA